jgi:hypothetical protein
MRMHLLSRPELDRLPVQYKFVQLRIPLRVDLRDIAKWIAGIDPFQPKPVELDGKEPRSLEGFLAGQVRFVSGGHEFNVSDLVAVARASHLLLALDGFDEVADVNLRQQLVAEITKGSIRLMNAGGFSVQTIVTSRPAAFAKSIRFPRDQWLYFELLPLEPRHVDNYTGKWMKAKGMKEAEQSQLRRILETKLKEAHTQFLAKNPMQLTILLSLIHNRGASLPEKRTAMYDTYMDMVFSRESEKSDIVRDNRELLVYIHRFLAWKLQTAAEAGENGSIEQGELRKTLLVYLDSEGENTGIVGDLFDGIVEGVGALVSRVQETYEFEVQPLREYFAARHLYDTAPYSPAGDEKTGTKLDRFDALIKNPYWLNVARFYGGCFSKGEISALVDELIELAKSDPYKFTSHPRSIALMLLGDWVFTQYQPAVREIVALIGTYPQFRQLLANADEAGAVGWSALPDRSGRVDLLDILWDRAAKTEHLDERGALAAGIVQNSTVEERVSRWKSIRSQTPHGRWVRLGGMLQIFEDSDPDQLSLLPEDLSASLISELVEARRFDYLERPDRFAAAHRALLFEVRLFAPIIRFARKNAPGRLAALATICSYYQYSVALNSEHAVPIRHALDHAVGYRLSDRTPAPDRERPPPVLTDRERDAVGAYGRFLDSSTAVTSTSLEPWVDLVEALRAAWGDCPAIDRIAFIGAGVRSKKEPGVDIRLEEASDLVRAARFVRLKSGAPRWWKERFRRETNSIERKRLLLLLWTWGTGKTIFALSDIIGEILNSLENSEWINLWRDFNCLSSTLRLKGSLTGISYNEAEKLKKLGARVCASIGLRSRPELRFELGMAVAVSNVKGDSPENSFALDAVISGCKEQKEWKAGLPYIRSLYARGATARRLVNRAESTMPQGIAGQISADPSKYPLSLVAAADSQLRSAAGMTAPKLLDVSNREGWFRQRVDRPLRAH